MCLQEPATGHYLEPFNASLFKTRLNIIRLDIELSRGPLPSDLWTKNAYALLTSLIRAACPSHFIHLDFVATITLVQMFSLFSNTIINVCFDWREITFHTRTEEHWSCAYCSL